MSYWSEFVIFVLQRRGSIKRLPTFTLHLSIMIPKQNYHRNSLQRFIVNYILQFMGRQLPNSFQKEQMQRRKIWGLPLGKVIKYAKEMLLLLKIIYLKKS